MINFRDSSNPTPPTTMRGGVLVVAALCLCVAATLMRSDPGPIGLEEDRLDMEADRLAQKIAKHGNPLVRQHKLRRPSSWEVPDLVHEQYPDNGIGTYSAAEHAIARGRAAMAHYSGPADLLEEEAKSIFPAQESEEGDVKPSTQSIQWNKLGNFMPPAAVASDNLTKNMVGMRNTMRVVNKVGGQQVAPREYNSWVSQNEPWHPAIQNHPPQDYKEYPRSWVVQNIPSHPATQNQPSLHWREHIAQQWPLEVAANEPQEPGYFLGRDGAPYKAYTDEDRKLREELQRQMEANGALKNRIHLMRTQFDQGVEGGEGAQEGAGVQKIVFRRRDREGDHGIGDLQVDRDGTLEADKDGQVESAIKARIERARDEAAAVAAAVKDGVRQGVEEAEAELKGDEEKVDEVMQGELAKKVADYMEPLMKRSEEQAEEMKQQAKLISQIAERLNAPAAPPAAQPAAAPSVVVVPITVPVASASAMPAAAMPVAAMPAAAGAVASAAASPLAVSFSLPGEVKLPKGNYAFRFGGDALPGAAASEPVDDSEAEDHQEQGQKPVVEGEAAEKAKKEEGGDGDHVLDSVVDMDNGIDMSAVEAAARELQKKLVEQASAQGKGDAASAPAAEAPAAAGAQGDDTLDTRTDTDNGVDMEAVRVAANALQKELIDKLTSKGGAAAGSEASSDAQGVLDSATGTDAGVDAAAVRASAESLQKKIIAELTKDGAAAPPGGDGVLDSATGTDAGVDVDAVKRSAEALQRDIISQVARDSKAASQGGDDVLDSATGTDSGVDAAAVRASAEALQRRLIGQMTVGGKSKAAAGGDDVLDSESGMSDGVSAADVTAAALRLQRQVASRLTLAGSA